MGVALDPTSQAVIAGRDGGGLARTVDVNLGDTWHPNQDGLVGGGWNNVAALYWSLTEANTVYALVGDTGGNGGFLVSPDGGSTWSMRSTGVQALANAAGSPPRPSTEDSATDRWVGHLITQDSVNGFTYACDVNSGVKRSADNGNTWTAIGLPVNPQYTRGIKLNPNNKKEGWVCAWSTNANNGGVWHCADLTVATPTWNRLGGYTGTVSDLKVLGSWLYAACNQGGVFRAPVGGGALVSLNGSYVLASNLAAFIFNSLDGYTDGSGNHVVVVSSGGTFKASGASHFRNIIRLIIPSTFPGTGSIQYDDLTNMSGGSINNATLPPDGRTWWKSGASFSNYLGGGAFKDGHLIIDQNNTSNIYIAGPGGVWRSLDGGVTWSVAINGWVGIQATDMAFDPSNANHFVAGGDDYFSFDLLGDPTGYASGSALPNVVGGPPGGTESHCTTFDPTDSNVFAGANEKYGKATGGGVWGRTTGASTFANELGFTTAAGGAACIGLYSGRDGSSNRFLIAIGQGSGAYRGTCPSGSNANLTASWTWTKLGGAAANIGATGNNGQFNPFAAKAGNSATIYVFDRVQGIYRSTDFGVTWTLIYSINGGGHIALNPNTSGELWVVNNANYGLFKLTGAGSGTVAGGQINVKQINTGTDGVNRIPDPGGIAFYQNTLYVVWENNSTHTSTQLMATQDGGNTFFDAGGTEIGAYVTDPRRLIINSAGLAALNTDYNGWVVGSLAAVTAPALAFSNTTLQPGVVGTPYNDAVTAIGGTPGYTFTINSGSVNAGLTLNADGSITGTPTTAGTSTFTVKVTDSVAATAISASLGITVTSVTVLGIDPPNLTDPKVGIPYSASITAHGGTSPYTFGLASGSNPLPDGLTLNPDGTITGTPTTAGPVTFTAQVTDNVSATATLSITITVDPAILTVLTSSLPNATVGAFFLATLKAVGGTLPYTWSISSGGSGGNTLPSWATFDPVGGTISGTPDTSTGSPFTLSFQVMDATGVTAQTPTLTLTVGVARLQVTTSGFARAISRNTYNSNVNATGGILTYTWALLSGTMPNGLTLNSDGSITGMPTTPGLFTFTVQVTDSASSTATATLVINIPALVAPGAVTAADSLVVSGQIELVGGIQNGGSPEVSTIPQCAGASFWLDTGYDLGSPQPTADIVASLILDGERPFGRRSSNRTIALPVNMTAPDRDTLAAAREVLMSLVDNQVWQLTWTRAGGLPLILDCFRAQPSDVAYSITDEQQLHASVTLHFQALPYGRSDTQEQLSFASPALGSLTPPAPVLISGRRVGVGHVTWQDDL